MSRRFYFLPLIIICLCSTISPSVFAEGVDANKSSIAEANKPRIALQLTTEENKKTIVATVTAAQKPVKDAKVTFFVKRTFGNLEIGHDETLDDGTAAVLFPLDLPGGTKGQLQVVAVITDPPQYSNTRTEEIFGGALVVPLQTENFPRALWAPQAPLALILTIGFIICVVWGTYIYVVVQLVRIRKGGIG